MIVSAPLLRRRCALRCFPLTRKWSHTSFHLRHEAPLLRAFHILSTPLPVILTMPGKHVRFEDIPPTPPSASSHLSSLPSTTGPITPPPISYTSSPYSSKPQPYIIDYHLHATLASFHAHTAKCDFALPTKYLLIHSILPPHVLTEAATSPPLPTMVITCPSLPWAIHVTASGSSKQGPFVTVFDVLDAIHRCMRVSVTQVEYKKVQALEEQQRIDETYRRRYKRMVADPVQYDKERSTGIRRVDFLLGRSMFAGLLSSGEHPERWELHIS